MTEGVEVPEHRRGLEGSEEKIDLFDEEKLSKKLIKIIKKIGLKPLLKMIQPFVGEETAKKIKDWVDDQTPNAERSLQKVLASTEDSLVHLIYGMKQQEVEALSKNARASIIARDKIIVLLTIGVIIETIYIIMSR